MRTDLVVFGGGRRNGLYRSFVVDGEEKNGVERVFNQP